MKSVKGWVCQEMGNAPKSAILRAKMMVNQYGRLQISRHPQTTPTSVDGLISGASFVSPHACSSNPQHPVTNGSNSSCALGGEGKYCGAAGAVSG